MSETLDRERVLHIAKLARVTLHGAEIPALTEQLGKILGHVAQLQQVDTEGVEPTAQVSVERLPLRDDVARASVPREVALAQAPETAGGGFVVPAFIEE